LQKASAFMICQVVMLG